MSSLIASEAEQLAERIAAAEVRLAEKLGHLEDTILATRQQIEEGQAAERAAFTDFADDVTAKLADLNSKLDAALAKQTADAAELADMKALSDDVLTSTNAMTDAIKAADVPVDRPVPQA